MSSFMRSVESFRHQVKASTGRIFVCGIQYVETVFLGSYMKYNCVISNTTADSDSDETSAWTVMKINIRMLTQRLRSCECSSKTTKGGWDFFRYEVMSRDELLNVELPKLKK